MIKTIQELKEQAEKVSLRFWKVHKCSMCNYKCGYIINGDRVEYDNGCGCSYDGGPETRSWEELTNTFNRNQPENNPDFKGTHPKEYEEHYKAWQFDTETV